MLDAAPEFPPLAMPSKVFTLKGSTLVSNKLHKSTKSPSLQRLPCVYRASPLGTAFWSDGGGNALPTKGRIRDQNGLLVIENVVSGILVASYN